MNKKTVIINRAVPGSGKTTITKEIVNTLNINNIPVKVCSTDEFFLIDDGRYDFDITKLYEYHQKNLDNFTDALMKKIDVVICDNTNLSPWQTKPYTDLARKYNYNVLFITFEPRELEKHVASQQVTKEKPDANGVSEDILKLMIKEYFDYNSLLDKNSIREINRHIKYVWNEELFKKIPSDEVSDYFDLDDIVKIYPNEYHNIQSTIGNKILHIIRVGIESE